VIVDLQAFAQFVRTAIPVNPLHKRHDTHPCIADVVHLLLEIACGMDILWNQEDPTTAPAHLILFQKYAKILTNNQEAERGNKDQNQAASYG
jgi:hypothetical protein